MSAKNPLLLLLLSWTLILPLHAQDIQWAEKLIGFSSQKGDKLFSATQVLGPPSRFPLHEFTPCSWMPSADKNEGSVFIHVGFRSVLPSSEILLIQSHVPSVPLELQIINTNGATIVLRGNTQTAGNRMRYRLNYPEVIAEIRIVWLPSQTNFQLDAIGIGNGEWDFDLLSPTSNTISNKAKKIISLQSSSDEVLPVWSKDGNMIYFDRKGHPENTGIEKLDDIWMSKRLPSGAWTQPEHPSSPLNNEQHNYVNAVTDDTPSLLLGNAYGGDNPLVVMQQIDNVWSGPKPVYVEGFTNADRFNEYHLSADGEYLLFAVEAADGWGLRDIYVSRRTGPNSFGKPANLGKSINTAAVEMSPSLSPDGTTLYFASNGRAGYGGYDIYASKRLDDTWTKWTDPVNLGPQINTAGWEAYFSVSPDATVALFASSFQSNNFDLMEVALTPAPPEALTLFVHVADKSDGLPVQAKVVCLQIEDAGGNKVATEMNRQFGNNPEVLPGSRYMLAVEADGYFGVVHDLLIADTATTSAVLDIMLIPRKAGATFNLEEVYFKANTSTLLDSSFTALTEMEVFLLAHREVNIEIRGHTNGLCDESYCLSLSRKRAEAIAAYLLSRGIAPERLTTNGMGKSAPVADDSTPEGRQKNQRVEIVLLKVE